MGRPLLHFVAIGLALFALERAGAALWGAGAAQPLVVPAERVEAVRAGLAQATGRAPDDADLRRALAPDVEDELLLREALARGYDREDPVVFRRLVQNLRFAGADPGQGDAALFAEALALGLQHTDVVARRRLVERVRLDFEARALRDPPDAAALRAWFEAHRERYVAPARVRLTQLFFRREATARRALGRLREEGATPDRAPTRGEPFLHPPEQPSQSREELARRFGAGFADAAFEAVPGRWEGPVASAYGSHLVWVHEREPARPLRLDEVRGAVRAAVVAERRREALETGIAGLRARADVRIAGLDPGAP